VTGTGHGEVTDALLAASRAMVALAARSLADFDADVTLTQYRTLVVLAIRGPRRALDIAADLRVNPSTGTRMCDRLVRKGLIARTRPADDRRVVYLALTPTGQTLVDQVTRHRREALSTLVDAIPRDSHEPLVTALHAFVVASNEPPQSEWWLGWHDDEPGQPGKISEDR
jgi:DNA-binding MarR family transcriptional regulator